jgi:hypothetical protein
MTLMKYVANHSRWIYDTFVKIIYNLNTSSIRVPNTSKGAAEIKKDSKTTEREREHDGEESVGGQLFVDSD